MPSFTLQLGYLETQVDYHFRGGIANLEWDAVVMNGVEHEEGKKIISDSEDYIVEKIYQHAEEQE